MCATLLAIPAIYACPWPLDARNPVVLLGAIQLALMDLCKIPSDNGKRMWTVLRSLGKGGCGEVYLAQEVGRESKGEYVALKIVKDKRQFLAELNTMKILNGHKLGRGNTPKLICACKKRRALVMDCHAESVATRFEKCRFKFSLKTVLMLALNMMTLSREFHDRTKMVHVDLKPSNFCTTHDGRKLVLIDFGYSTPPTVCLPGQTGTPLFMSWTIQSQGAVAPIWQDDLESLGYVIMFFVGGGKRGLPWGSMRTHRDIASAKNDDTIRSFCAALESTEFAPLAQPLLTYMFVTRDRIRKFVDADFEALFNMFHSVFTACGFVNDGMYDWCLNKKHASAHAAQHLAVPSQSGPAPARRHHARHQHAPRHQDAQHIQPLVAVPAQWPKLDHRFAQPAQSFHGAAMQYHAQAHSMPQPHGHAPLEHARASSPLSATPSPAVQSPSSRPHTQLPSIATFHDPAQWQLQQMHMHTESASRSPVGQMLLPLPMPFGMQIHPSAHQQLLAQTPMTAGSTTAFSSAHQAGDDYATHPLLPLQQMQRQQHHQQHLYQQHQQQQGEMAPLQMQTAIPPHYSFTADGAVGEYQPHLAYSFHPQQPLQHTAMPAMHTQPEMHGPASSPRLTQTQMQDFSAGLAHGAGQGQPAARTSDSYPTVAAAGTGGSNGIGTHGSNGGSNGSDATLVGSVRPTLPPLHAALHHAAQFAAPMPLSTQLPLPLQMKMPMHLQMPMQMPMHLQMPVQFNTHLQTHTHAATGAPTHWHDMDPAMQPPAPMSLATQRHAAMPALHAFGQPGTHASTLTSHTYAAAPPPPSPPPPPHASYPPVPTEHTRPRSAPSVQANLDPPAEYYPGTVNNPLVLI